MNTRISIKNNGHTFITNGEDYQDYPEGIWIYSIKTPVGVPINKQNKLLYGIGLGALALNPHATQEDLIDYLHSVNVFKLVITNKFSNKQIYMIAKSIFEYRTKVGTIELKPNTIKYTVYSLDCELTLKERRQHTNKLNGERKTFKTQSKMNELIENWNWELGKINQKKLSKILTKKYGKGFSVDNIKKNWSLFKDIVKSMNKQEFTFKIKELPLT